MTETIDDRMTSIALKFQLSESSAFPLDSGLLDANLERAFAFLKRTGARVIYPGHPDFPFAPTWAGVVPPFLTYWGEPVWKTKPSISVVGSREPSRAALNWMERHLTEFVQKHDCAIVSGGARGCDQKAHLIAMRAKKPTVVFLPSGLGVPYPEEWADWKDQVLAGGGAIVSTYAPFQEIQRGHFAERNRWIALIGRLLFIVEARRRSGSLMTARLAREADRTVCVLPGRPDDSLCAGTNDQLFEGAFPVRDAQDLAVLFSLVSATRDEG